MTLIHMFGKSTPIFRNLCFLISTFLALPNVLSAQNSNNDSGKISYQDGIKIEFFDTSHIIKSVFKFGGRIHFDASFIHQNEKISEKVGESHNQQQLRRIFFFHTGTFFNNGLGYKIQFDFSGGNLGFRDVYVEPRLFQTKSLEGYLRVGQFKDPFRFENQLSSNNLSLIERSYLFSFAPLRNTGFMYHMNLPDQSFSFQLAYLQNSSDAGVDLSPTDGFNLTSRVTLLPINHQKLTLHTGVGFSIRNRGSQGEYKINARPPVQALPNYITLSLSGISDADILSLEAALIKKQMMIISEYIDCKINGSIDYHMRSFYGQMSYFLDKKSYHTYTSSILGIKDIIAENGAFEIALRYAMANYDTINDNESEIWDLTFGINYYVNTHFRFMVNFSVIELRSIGHTETINFRLQTTF